MSRSIRLEHPGAIWHITSRGNERRTVFFPDEDRQSFLSILAEVVELHRWIVYAYCLMGNHYHLLIETPAPTLSVGAKRLNERFAQRLNRQHARVGHVFQGRFKAILVEREAHLLELLRYVVLNPVRAGIVRYPGDYSWSSYRATAGLGDAPAWLDVDAVLAEFGAGSRAERSERYRRFVADARGAEYKPWEQLTAQIYLGSAAFCERVKSLVGTRRDEKAYPEPQRVIVRPSWESILRQVAEVFKIPEQRVLARSHESARKALAQLAWREGGLTFSTIGQRMNICDRAACHLARCGERLEAETAEYADRVQRIRQQIEAASGSCG